MQVFEYSFELLISLYPWVIKLKPTTLTGNELYDEQRPKCVGFLFFIMRLNLI